MVGVLFSDLAVLIVYHILAYIIAILGFDICDYIILGVNIGNKKSSVVNVNSSQMSKFVWAHPQRRVKLHRTGDSKTS